MSHEEINDQMQVKEGEVKRVTRKRTGSFR